MPEKETILERKKRIKEEAISKIAIEDCIITEVDVYGDEYKALNMEKIGDYLPEIEEKFNFIKNMDKNEILEFMHERKIGEYDSERQCFPTEILKYMNPEYLKDDELVQKILDSFILEAPYDEWDGNEYFLLADDCSTSHINKNYKAFYDRLTSEQQTKFSHIVAYKEPALATNLKDVPPYFAVQFLWENDRFEEIFEHSIEDVEEHVKSYAEDYMDDIKTNIEDEEVVSADKLEFLSKLYTITYGKDIKDDEEWRNLLQQNKVLEAWETRDIEKIEEYMKLENLDNPELSNMSYYLNKKLSSYMREIRKDIEEYEEVIEKDEIEFFKKAYSIIDGRDIEEVSNWAVLFNRNSWNLHEEMQANGIDQIPENDNSEITDEDKSTSLEDLSDEELEKMVVDNEEKISSNNKTIHDKLVEKILSQQQTIAEQEAEIARLTSQKSKES